MRVFLPFLLAASLLACPLKCMTGAIVQGPCTMEQGRTHMCGCCSQLQDQPQSTPQSPVPHTPGDDCQCPTCFCHGAVVSSNDADFDGDPLRPHALDDCFIESLTFDPAAIACASAWCDWRHSTRLSEGPPARILHQAFLL